MKAAVYTGPSRVETRDTAEPSLQPGDVLLRVRACGVCGTDVMKVRHGWVKPPVILGHEVAGDVVAMGDGVQRFSIGDRVVVAHHTPCYACQYCRHGNYSMCAKFKESNLDPGGFAEFVRVPAGHVAMTAHRIPDGMPYERAIFMEPLACILRNLKRTTILPGDTVAIIGLGSMGLLTGQLIRRIGARVVGSDLREDRRALARHLGFEAVTGGDQVALHTEIQRLSDDRGADLVVLTAGNSQVYSEAIRLLRNGGTLNVFAGLAPGEKMTYDANEIYRREITIYSSYSPSPDELAEAMAHLTAGTVDVDVLAAKSFPLEGVSDAVNQLIDQQILKAVIHPEVAQP